MTEEKNKFLFSIIVPVYNTEKYVEKTLKSIYEAMDRDCEVIVVNDGSKDNSEEIIKKFINALPEEYKNNFVYVKKDNKGLADTKNVGIAKARGEFISVVDSDDYIDKNFYKIAREYVKDNDIIIYDLYVVFEKNPLWNYTSRACRDDKENFLDGLINGAMSGSSCNKIIKKELLYKTKGDYENEIEKVYCNDGSNSNGCRNGNRMWRIKIRCRICINIHDSFTGIYRCPDSNVKIVRIVHHHSYLLGCEYTNILFFSNKNVLKLIYFKRSYL